MSILQRLFSRMKPAPVELDIVPTVRPIPEPKPVKVATTLDDAKRRHGRAFKAQQQITRTGPVSDDLAKLNRLSDEAAGKTILVTDISSRRK